MSSDATIRPYRPADRDDVYDVCVRTADGGGDARGLWSTDDLMPDIFAGPYLELEPDLVFVVDDGQRVVGYVLGAADTARWAAEHRARWLPRMVERYPLPVDVSTPEDHMVDLLHHPERNVRPGLEEYPAHLHIDLLPSHQGRGLGRALVRTLLAALHERGVPGLHLGMAPTNLAAGAFYERLGFTRLPVGSGDVTFYGIRTDHPL